MSKLIACRLLPGSHPHLVVLLGEMYNGALDQLSTKPLRRNTPEEQLAWWAALPQEVVVHLYSPVEEPWRIVAFSMVRDRGTFCTPMFAVVPGEHGKGYGAEIIRHYLSVAWPKPLVGSQLVSNGAIRHLNNRYGWEVTEVRDGVEYLFHPSGRDYPQSTYDEIIRYHLGGPDAIQS